MTDLGDRVKAARNARGWSQHTLAGKLGVSKLTILKYESGQTVPRDTNRAKLFSVLGIADPGGRTSTPMVQMRSTARQGEAALGGPARDSLVNRVLDRTAVAVWWYEQLPTLLQQGITHSQSSALIKNAIASANLTAQSADVDMLRLSDQSLVELISPLLTAHLSGQIQLAGTAVGGPVATPDSE
jgi:transcriptional regulator with XRE-family HTH domain